MTYVLVVLLGYAFGDKPVDVMTFDTPAECEHFVPYMAQAVALEGLLPGVVSYTVGCEPRAKA